MAKIKLTAIVADIRGKLNGTVFSKNRSGAYMRTKVTPVNAQTASQTFVRQIFAFLSSLWGSLTDAQRLSYNTKVEQYARTDIFGDLRNPSGKSLFQRLNQNLKLLGLVHQTTCPNSASICTAGVDTFEYAVGLGTLNLTLGALATPTNIMVSATPSLSQGKAFVKNDFRMIKSFTATDVSALDILQAYTDKFGAIADGDNIHVKIVFVNDNGQASPPVMAKMTYVA